MSEILPRLWLGNERDATNRNFLRDKSISIVVSVEEFPTNWHPTARSRRGHDTFPSRIERHHFSMRDSQQEADSPTLLPKLDAIADVIDKTLKDERAVLVHCSAGKSRSVACLCYFLVSRRGHTVGRAMQAIKAARPIADPHPAFILRLQRSYT